MRIIVRFIFSAASVLGAVMMFESSLITLLPKEIMPYTDTDIQRFGLTLFVCGVVFTLLVGTIDEFLKSRNEPRLFINGYKNETKTVYGGGIGSDVLGDYEFIYAIVENRPQTESNGLSAQSANAKIIFETRNGKRKEIEYLRWCDIENALFPMITGDINKLKRIDIDPGNPESLVLAFKKENDKNIYGFFFTDHRRFTSEEIQNFLEERLIGKPPIKITITIRGKFERKEFQRILDIDSNGKFILE